jgi:hypothetical protein
MYHPPAQDLALLEIDLKILLRKTRARLNFKIALISMHFDPGAGLQSSCLRSILIFTEHNRSQIELEGQTYISAY